MVTCLRVAPSVDCTRAASAKPRSRAASHSPVRRCVPVPVPERSRAVYAFGGVAPFTPHRTDIARRAHRRNALSWNTRRVWSQCRARVNARVHALPALLRRCSGRPRGKGAGKRGQAPFFPPAKGGGERGREKRGLAPFFDSSAAGAMGAAKMLQDEKGAWPLFDRVGQAIPIGSASGLRMGPGRARMICSSSSRSPLYAGSSKRLCISPGSFLRS